MIVMSHRGLWKAPAEKNAREAFERTVARNFGTETDVRDCLGSLVVAHDPAMGNAMPWAEVVELFQGSGLPLAVNIKADGLSTLVADALEGRGIDWFAFDMSGPETVRYAAQGLPFFTRHSDVEPLPILYDQAAGVWLDSFGPTWFDPAVILSHLQAGKRVCVVSCELHGRDPTRLWDALAQMANSNALMICTDRPEEARARFSA